MTENRKLVVFEDKNIRRIWFNDEWYFSVVDIIAVLTESPTPRQYWGKVKDREFSQLQLSPIWVQLKLQASDGKLRLTDFAKRTRKDIEKNLGKSILSNENFLSKKKIKKIKHI